MPQTIYLLDSLTIDKIAAGEVIESPSSCVKELVDNALDAGARSLLVEIQLGGRELIMVQDDGKGMCQEDLSLSCERHATSKIKNLEDLDSLTSLGFRGEALSSIASISKMSVRSRERGGSDTSPIGLGAELLIEGGRQLGLNEVTAKTGTQVTVKDLFYNVPARRKFLKPPAKNGLEVLKTVKHLALISPNVAFSLISDKKTVFQVPSHNTLEERIKAVLGEPFSSSSLPLHFQKKGLTIEGQLVLPEQARKNRSGQYLFVNGRPITSFVISAIMKSAYSTSLQSDEYPQYVLSLQIDPERVDMNVHPQKKEVRFADEEWIKAELYEAVSYALFATEKAPQFQEVPSRPSFEVRQNSSPQFILAPPKKKMSFSYSPLFDESLLPPPPKEIYPNKLKNCDFSNPTSAVREDSKQAHICNMACFESSRNAGVGDEKANSSVCLGIQQENTFQYHFQLGPYACINISNRGLLLINLIQALLSTLSQAMKRDLATTASQMLLQPELIELGPLEMECLEGKINTFSSMGFGLSQFGTNSFLLESIPSFLDPKMAVQCIKELIEEQIHDDAPFSERVHARLSTACMRAYPELAEEKIDGASTLKIIDNWIKAGSPACTLFGKKVYLPIEKKSLDAFFERNV